MASPIALKSSVNVGVLRGGRGATRAMAMASARRPWTGPALPSSVSRCAHLESRARVSISRTERSLATCRATADGEESPSEKRKVLKNVFYVAAAVALPIVGWSEFVTATTGAGLQGAVLGGLEGVSYLVLLGLVGKSIALKVRTGTGLPAGPYGLIGALEGVAYLEIVGLVVSQVLKATKGV